MPIFVKCVRTVYINVKRGVQDIENKAWYLHNKESRFVLKLISKGQNSQFNRRLKVTIISFVALKTCVTCKWCRTHSLIPKPVQTLKFLQEIHRNFFLWEFSDNCERTNAILGCLKKAISLWHHVVSCTKYRGYISSKFPEQILATFKRLWRRETEIFTSA